MREAELLLSGVGRGVTPLRPEWREILDAMSELGVIKATARNDHVVLEQWGTLPGASPEAGCPPVPAIDLRLYLRRWAFGFAVEEEGAAGVRSSVQFFDQCGDSILKVFVEDRSRSEVFRAIRDRFGATSTNCEPLLPRPSAPLASTRDPNTLRTRWDGLVHTHEFAPLLEELKLGRVEALRMAGESRARPVSGDSLANLLSALAHKRFPFLLFVGNRGVFQILTGKVTKVRRTADWVNVLDPDMHLHVRSSGLASGWVVRKPTTEGLVSSLELYDAAEETLALLFSNRGAGESEPEEWRSLLAELS
jgi:putative hemin transport protein